MWYVEISERLVDSELVRLERSLIRPGGLSILPVELKELANSYVKWSGPGSRVSTSLTIDNCFYRVRHVDNVGSPLAWNETIHQDSLVNHVTIHNFFTHI